MSAAPQSADTTATALDPISEVDPQPAANLMSDGQTVLVDVREDDEWDAGHAPDAVHIPLGALDPRQLPSGQTILAVCRSGNRSGNAAVILAAAGMTVRNLAGGMRAWDAAGLPVIRDDGTPGSVI
jgi:rhodanese-related sulfurtransferase